MTSCGSGLCHLVSLVRFAVPRQSLKTHRSPEGQSSTMVKLVRCVLERRRLSLAHRLLPALVGM